MTDFRILVTVTEGSPELYESLARIPARLRAERLRTLASLGIAALQAGRDATLQHHGHPTTTNTSSLSDTRAAKVRSLAKRLGGDL